MPAGAPAQGILDPVIVIKLAVIFFRHALYLAQLQNAVARRFARFAKVEDFCCQVPPEPRGRPVIKRLPQMLHYR